MTQGCHPVPEGYQSLHEGATYCAALHEGRSTLQADVVIVGCGVAGLYAVQSLLWRT